MTHYQMLPEMGPPDTVAYEYPRPDMSWGVEFEEFLEDIAQGRTPEAGLGDALAAIRIVETIYGRGNQ